MQHYSHTLAECRQMQAHPEIWTGPAELHLLGFHFKSLTIENNEQDFDHR